MGTLEDKQDALKLVADAATIHADSLRRTLGVTGNNPSFDKVRGAYIAKLSQAVAEVQQIKLDETLKVSERVQDLTLEEAVDLLHAVEDRIRSLRRHNRSEFQ